MKSIVMEEIAYLLCANRGNDLKKYTTAGGGGVDLYEQWKIVYNPRCIGRSQRVRKGFSDLGNGQSKARSLVTHRIQGNESQVLLILVLKREKY